MGAGRGKKFGASLRCWMIKVSVMPIVFVMQNAISLKTRRLRVEGFITRTLRFGDGEELELKLVHDAQEESRKNYSLPLALIVLMVLGITCAV